MNLSNIPGAKNFAHLVTGRGTVIASKGKKAESDKEETDEEDELDEEEKEEPKKGKKAGSDKEPPRDDKEDGKKASAKKAKDSESDDPCMSEDDEEEADDNDDDEEGDKKKKVKRAFASFDKATLARCRSIFASAEAANNVAMACKLAFDTRVSASEAIGILGSATQPEATAPTRSRRLSEKMESIKSPDVGVDSAKPGAGASEATSLAARIVAAGERANGNS